MNFRLAVNSDFESIVKIYDRARNYMSATGNPAQWKNNYPGENDIRSDMESKNLFVLCDEDGLQGVFAYIPDADDITYRKIDGEWLNDLPYAAVHRVASAGKKKGILKLIMDYCFSHSDNVKIDTHRDNIIMQHQLEKYGFSRCGIIYLLNGEERIAYQMKK